MPKPPLHFKFRAGFGAPATAGVTYLLDDYGTDIYWAGALFRLKSDFAGVAARVRKTADGTVANIYLNGDEIDVAAIASHCTTSNGTLAVLGDQSESGNFLVGIESVTSWQPKVYDGVSQSVVTDPDNGKPAWYYSGSTLLLQSDVSTLIPAPTTHFAVAHREVAGGTNTITDSKQTAQHSLTTLGDNKIYVASGNTVCNFTYGTATDNDIFLGVVGAGASCELWFGGSQRAIGNSGTNAMYGLRIGVSSGFNNFFQGHMQAVGIYSANKSADLQAISDTLNSYAGVY